MPGRLFNPLLALGLAALLDAASGTYQTLTTHSLRKTASAQAKGQELWCYSCDSMEDGEMCTDLTGNNSHLFRKCKPEEPFCSIKRISYTIAIGSWEYESNTTTPRLWSLQRQCTNACVKGCIVIGERTKLYACSSCCNTPLCNTGEGRAARAFGAVNNTLIGTLLLLGLGMAEVARRGA